MIRLIQRRLIIPRGDTGSFTIPALKGMQQEDVAVFSIYDPLTKQTVFEKNITMLEEKLTVSLSYDDTVNLLPKNYLWDIKVYHGNIKYNEDDEELEFEKKRVIGADSIDSYYAAFSLPICEIREVAKNV